MCLCVLVKSRLLLHKDIKQYCLPMCVNVLLKALYLSTTGVMVRQDEPMMGQGGLCGVTSPGIDSLPPITSPPTAGTNANGIASEVQVWLSNV